MVKVGIFNHSFVYSPNSWEYDGEMRAQNEIHRILLSGRKREGRKMDAIFTAEMLPMGDIRRTSNCLGDVALLDNYSKPGQSHCLR